MLEKKKKECYHEFSPKKTSFPAIDGGSLIAAFNNQRNFTNKC